MSVGGLASGLDTTSIINGLIQIEMSRVTREENKKKDYELKLTEVNNLKSKLNDFYTKAQGMDKSTAFNVFSSSSSDETIAKISGEDAATPGNYDVQVQGLASTIKVASKAYTNAQATAAMGLTGAFTVSTSAASQKTDPTVLSVEVDLDGSETLKDIALKINRAKGTGATASVIKMGADDYRLMLTAVDEGTKGFALEQTGAGSILSDGLDLVKEGGAGTVKESLRTDFDFRLKTGGPALATTKFQDLFNGIGSSSPVEAGDILRLSGTRADGSTFTNQDFTLGDPATETLQSLLTTGTNSIESVFGGAASVDVSLNSSGEIVVTDKLTGTTSMTLTMSFVDAGAASTFASTGTGAVRTEFKNVISDGKKAFYLMNDLAMSSQSNKDNTTVTGTVFEFKKVSTDTIKLTLDYDKEGIKKKVQEFLDTYNQMIKFLDEKSKIEIKKKEGANGMPAKGTEIIKGPFAGDSSILGLKSTIQGMMTNKISELTDAGLSKFSSLASMGIVSEQKTGFLTIDDTKFKAALDTDFEGVKRVFMTGGYSDNAAHTFGTYTKDTKTGRYYVDRIGANSLIDTDATSATNMVTGTISGDSNIINSDSGDSKGLAVKAAAASGAGTMTFVRGVAGQVKDFYEKITNFVDGFMTETAKTIQKRIDTQEKQIERLDKQVARVRERLTKEFANLEMSISKLKSQSASFQGQIR